MKRVHLLAPLLAAAITAVPATADAQLPSFMTLDRMDSVSRFGLQLGITEPDGDDNLLGLRTELHGQFIVGDGGFGLYGQLPLGHMLVEDADDETMVLQNLEVGGFAVHRSRTAELIFRLGLVLPTAEDDVAGVVTNIITHYERGTDFVAVPPDSTFLRLSFSPLLTSGSLLFRADVGTDLLIKSDNDPDSRILGRLNGGLGVMVGEAAIMFELVNLGLLDDDGDLTDRFRHSLALGVSTMGQTQVHFGLVFPLDEDERGDLWIFSFGIKGAR